MQGLKVEAVDATGAGDAFVAGILSQLSTDFSLLQVLPNLFQIIQLFPSSFFFSNGSHRMMNVSHLIGSPTSFNICQILS